MCCAIVSRIYGLFIRNFIFGFLQRYLVDYRIMQCNIYTLSKQDYNAYSVACILMTSYFALYSYQKQSLLNMWYPSCCVTFITSPMKSQTEHIHGLYGTDIP